LPRVRQGSITICILTITYNFNVALRLTNMHGFITFQIDDATCYITFDLVYSAKRHFLQCFCYIVAVSFIGGGKRSTRRKPPTCRKSLINFIILCCIEPVSISKCVESIFTRRLCRWYVSYHTCFRIPSKRFLQYMRQFTLSEWFVLKVEILTDHLYLLSTCWFSTCNQ
jgi:hypothetical protein